MKKIKAVIFDWNGVITDSLKLDHSIFIDDIKKKNLKASESLKFYRDLYNSNIFKALLKIGFTKQDFENDVEYKRLYLENMHKSKIFPGMKQVLKTLKRKYKLAMVSSNYKAAIDTFNRKYGLGGIFDCILTADEHKMKEEKIKIFLDKFYLKKSEVIFIGDVVSDIMACRKTGLKIIAVTWGYHEKYRLKRAKPDFIAERPKDIIKILDKLGDEN